MLSLIGLWFMILVMTTGSQLWIQRGAKTGQWAIPPKLMTI